MANKNKKIHIPFSKPFYKLLGGSVLSLAAIYGGIVWANSVIGCNINVGGFNIGRVCAELTFDSNPNDSDPENSREIFEVKDANNDSNIGAGGYDAGLVGKELRFTNNATDKSLFVPLRQKNELDSFLDARVDAINEAAAINVSDPNLIPLLSKIDVCELGLPSNKLDWNGNLFNWERIAIYSEAGTMVANNCSQGANSWDDCTLIFGTAIPPVGFYYIADGSGSGNNWCRTESDGANNPFVGGICLSAPMNGSPAEEIELLKAIIS